MELNESNLDLLIQHWRNRLTIARQAKNEEAILIARCYIDAYQTVRVNHGLPLLPPDASDIGSSLPVCCQRTLLQALQSMLDVPWGSIMLESNTRQNNIRLWKKLQEYGLTFDQETLLKFELIKKHHRNHEDVAMPANCHHCRHFHKIEMPNDSRWAFCRHPNVAAFIDPLQGDLQKGETLAESCRHIKGMCGIMGDWFEPKDPEEPAP